MEITIPQPKFNINDDIYHITPGSNKGIILDISYSFRLKMYRYRVVFGIGDDNWYDEEEINKDKRR